MRNTTPLVASFGSGSPPSVEDVLDQLRLLDTRDYLQPPAAARALLDLDPEYANVPSTGTWLVALRQLGRRALLRRRWRRIAIS